MSLERKKEDRRKTRTRRSLGDALIGLILEKRYDAITVQNVIDRADVGRSTFYTHYRDKEDLFRSDIEDFLDGFVSHIQWENLKEGRFIPVRELFTHVRDFNQFYKALVKSRKTNLFYKTSLSHLTKSMEQKLTSSLADQPQPSVPLAITSNFLASGLLDLLKWWVDHEMPYTPERMDEIFHELVMPGFRSALLNSGVNKSV